VPEDPKLARYREKRVADQTSEPFGDIHARPRLFVIHKHAATQTHYDLRLEWDGVLWSWAVPRGPCLDPEVKRLAVKVEEHPVEYADFEGVIPKGNYGAGPIIVWDRGQWEPYDDPNEGLRKGMLHFALYGFKLRGGWTLVRLKDEPKQWLMIKKADGFEHTEGELPFGEESILSGLTVEELGEGSTRAQALREEAVRLGAKPRKQASGSMEPALAETADQVFSDPSWLYELKYDGFRLLAERTDGKDCILRYRSGYRSTQVFPDLVRALRRWPFRDFVIDGEVVVLDEEGRSDFQMLQRRTQLSRRRDIEQATVNLAATYFVFDLLAFDDLDLRPLPLRDRKALLERMLPKLGPIRYSDHIEGIGEKFFDLVKAKGLEGIMAKKADQPYRAGRSKSWLKMPADRRADFVIVGFSEPGGSRPGIGSLDVAAYVNDKLTYAGRVGTGFSDQQLVALRALLEPDIIDEAPCVGPVRKKTHWTRPKHVCECRYKTWTDDGKLRHPVFLGLRPDKGIDECHRPAGKRLEEPETIEEFRPEDKKVPFTRPEKVFWPKAGYTKGDLVEYYRAVSSWLLPYLAERPVVLTRYPDGINGKSFYQKDAPGFIPEWIRTETMWSQHAEREIRYIICDSQETLLYLANLGTIPLHIWGSRLDTLERPDWCLIDLDPKEAPFEDVVDLAIAVHELCEEIGLPSFVKTSGSTGLHVLIPLAAQCNYEQCRSVAHLISQVIVNRHPEIATLVRNPERRGGKVYFDWQQNGHGQLMASPLCVRPKPGATVSTPLLWQEVNRGLHPERFNIKSVPERLERMPEDPLIRVLDTKPDLLAALGALAEMGDD
jgi:bifunctional non-homologous end joining protein LigD